ncbi:MAG: phage shock protein PspA [Spirochaetales bacterium]|nr:phage shock protein PspA [Spirochaetales bacterium]
MGVFTRFKDIVNANINAILDKAEDPEKMINLMMREMEDTLVELKSSCASKMAERAKVEREKGFFEEKTASWDSRAKLAVEKGRDDLAREALQEKQKCTDELEYLTKDWEHLNNIVDESRSEISQLEEKLEQVRQKHRQLIQRGRHAQEKKRARESMRQASSTAAMDRFDRMENQIERMEAEADLYGNRGSNDIESRFADLEKNDSVEEELAALKKSMKK